jgi:hypothetical protein
MIKVKIFFSYLTFNSSFHSYFTFTREHITSLTLKNWFHFKVNQ